MSLAKDLLELARDLLQPDGPERRGRPQQAKLRRSVSTAYYSLFALLVEEAATRTVGGGNENKALRGYMMRAVSHKTIKKVCAGFANRNPNDNIKKALNGHRIPGELADIARICHDLQTYRHEADYNFIYSFKKAEADIIVGQAEQAHEKWETVKSYEATRVFLAALIVDGFVQQSGGIIGTQVQRSETQTAQALD